MLQLSRRLREAGPILVDLGLVLSLAAALFSLLMLIAPMAVVRWLP